MVEMAGEIWPAVYWTAAPESREFHLRLVERGIARPIGADYYEFVPKAQRTCC
jgi:hypothetical protein